VLHFRFELAVFLMVMGAIGKRRESGCAVMFGAVSPVVMVGLVKRVMA
jgi:hypothetical protein